MTNPAKKDSGRWFYCKGCSRPAVIFEDGSAGHSNPTPENPTECAMFAESNSAEFARLNVDAIACRVPPEFS